MNHVRIAMDQAADLILGAYRQAAAQGLLPEHPFTSAPVEIPKDVKNGDLLPPSPCRPPSRWA